ncbi:hypothetical protein [Mycolicibacterium sarraceniae]|uniref:hypothetical protein n=1 Tax=Mycolicibacterium sarraceniae TaxID=1534348 RepID=UPI0013D21CFF|nr:hypothetical protein [Mycolicibacterium sarraceniae]
MRPTLSAIDRFHDGLCYTAPGPDGTIGVVTATDDAEAVRTLATHAADAVADRIGADALAHPWTYSTFFAVYPVGTKLGWHDDGAHVLLPSSTTSASGRATGVANWTCSIANPRTSRRQAN